MGSKNVYDGKRIIRGDGGFLRPKVQVKEKHLPLRMTEHNEQSRINDAVAERGSVSLRESFDLNLFENPVWKSVDKAKWRGDPRGMSHKGRTAAHVGTIRSSLLGGSNTMAKTNVGLTWKMIKNEDPKGQNPYSVSHPEIAKLLTERKRNIVRE